MHQQHASTHEDVLRHSADDDADVDLSLEPIGTAALESQENNQHLKRIKNDWVAASIITLHNQQTQQKGKKTKQRNDQAPETQRPTQQQI